MSLAKRIGSKLITSGAEMLFKKIFAQLLISELI